MDSERIGATLKQLRIDRGRKLVDVATAVGLSVSEVHRFETGSSVLSVPMLLKLLDALGVSLGRFEVELEGNEATPEKAARWAAEWLLRFADLGERQRG
jgi:transcriptional regulator with XRE-family HTH domain